MYFQKTQQFLINISRYLKRYNKSKDAIKRMIRNMRTDILGMKSMLGRINISMEGLEDKICQTVEYEKKGKKHSFKRPNSIFNRLMNNSDFLKARLIEHMFSFKLVFFFYHTTRHYHALSYLSKKHRSNSFSFFLLYF